MKSNNENGKLKYYVYEWIRLDTNEPFYVGKGSRRRWKQTNNREPEFKKIIEDVECAVNILVDDIEDEDVAYDIECWYINEYKYVIGYDMVNTADGGRGHGMVGENNHMYGKYNSDYCSKSVTCINDGTQYPSACEAARKTKISNSAITAVCKGNRKYTGTNDKGEPIVWCYTNIYKTMSQKDIDDKINIARQSLLSRTKSKDNPRSKKVICVDTGVIYNSSHEAADAYNCNSGTISQCCNHKYKHAKGMEWMWLDEYNNKH